MASGPIISWQIDGEKKCKQWQILFYWAPKSLWAVTSTMKLKGLLLGKKAMTNLDSVVRSRDITLPTKVYITKAVIFPVIMYRYESWTIRLSAEDWCFQTVVLEKTLESPLNSKEMKPVNPKGNQPRIFIRRTDAKAEAPILWAPDAKGWLIGKDSDAGKDWGQKDKGVTEEIVGWHHRLSGYEFEQTGRSWRTVKPGVLLFMRSDMTEQLSNNTTSTIQVWVLLPQSACHKQLPGGHRHGMRGQSNKSWYCSGLSYPPIQSYVMDLSSVSYILFPLDDRFLLCMPNFITR